MTWPNFIRNSNNNNKSSWFEIQKHANRNWRNKNLILPISSLRCVSCLLSKAQWHLDCLQGDFSLLPTWYASPLLTLLLYWSLHKCNIWKWLRKKGFEQAGLPVLHNPSGSTQTKWPLWWNSTFTEHYRQNPTFFTWPVWRGCQAILGNEDQ